MGRYALVVGNSTYLDDGLCRLTAPEVDVTALSEILRTPQVGGFDQVVTLLNEPSSIVRKAIASLFARKQRDDLLLLYFSGHGVLDENGLLYLAVTDTERDLLNGTAIDSSFIKTLMDQSRSSRQLLILDCCQSGAFGRGAKAALQTSVGTKDAFEGTGSGRVVLTATDATQFAWEGEKVIGEAQKSIFTRCLIDGLQTGEADLDEDGQISVNELYHYVYDRVLAETPRQTPMIWSYKQQGEMMVACNPQAGQYMKRLPDEVRECLNDARPTVRLGVVLQLERLLQAGDPALARAARQALELLRDDPLTQVSRAAEKVLKDEAHQDKAPAGKVAQQSPVSISASSHPLQPAQATPAPKLPVQQPAANVSPSPAARVSQVGAAAAPAALPARSPNIPPPYTQPQPSVAQPKARPARSSKTWAWMGLLGVFACAGLAICLVSALSLNSSGLFANLPGFAPTASSTLPFSQVAPSTTPPRWTGDLKTPSASPLGNLPSMLSGSGFQVEPIADDFVDNRSGWDVSPINANEASASFQILDGTFRWTWETAIDSYGLFRDYPGETFQNVGVGTQVDLSGAPEHGFAGLYLRRQNNTGGYEVVISNTGYYRFSRRSGNDLIPLIDWTGSEVIVPYGVNDLILMAIGPNFSAMVNNQVLFQIEDGTFLEGAVGLLVGHGYAGDLGVYDFNSFLIFDLDQ